MIHFISPTSKSDLIGGIAGILCLIHCLATPLFFVVHAGAITAGGPHPWWWGILDLVFLGISFFAVYWSAKNTTRPWVRWVFWGMWVALAVVILNEKFLFWTLPKAAIYPPTLGLIILHFYNRRYFRCTSKKCSVH